MQQFMSKPKKTRSPEPREQGRKNLDVAKSFFFIIIYML